MYSSLPSQDVKTERNSCVLNRNDPLSSSHSHVRLAPRRRRTPRRTSRPATSPRGDDTYVSPRPHVRLAPGWRYVRPTRDSAMTGRYYAFDDGLDVPVAYMVSAGR